MRLHADRHDTARTIIRITTGPRINGPVRSFCIKESSIVGTSVYCWGSTGDRAVMGENVEKQWERSDAQVLPPVEKREFYHRIKPTCKVASCTEYRSASCLQFWSLHFLFALFNCKSALTTVAQPSPRHSRGINTSASLQAFVMD